MTFGLPALSEGRMQHSNRAASEAVTTADIASALGISKRSAELRAERGEWPYTEEAVRGGKRRLYVIADLPSDVRTELARHTITLSAPSTLAPMAGPSSPAHTRTTCFSSDPRAERLAASYEAAPETQKADARALLVLVQECRALIVKGFAWRAIAPALAAKHDVSVSTLSRAWRKVKAEPAQLWLYLLLKGYAGRQRKTELSAEAWEVLQGDFLRLERPTAAACIERLLAAAKGHPDWIIPSKRTLERRLEEIHEVTKVLKRDGVKAAKQLYPAQQRLKSALAALEIVNGDGYKHNLWVRFPDGDVVRAVTWYWQDVHSSKVLAWRTDKTEHTDIIRLSFGDLIDNYGIPEISVVDNTHAAANKTMTGGAQHRFRFRVREEEPLGIFGLLNVQYKPTTVAWGQAKPVERVFGVGGVGEYIDKAPEFAGAWTGGSPLDKPDYDGKHRAIELADLERVIVREIGAWNARTGRRGAMHIGGKSCDALFEASYQVTPVRRATEAQRRLWLLASEPVLASSKNGEITLDAGRVVGERVANRYWSIEMANYAGRKVCARFDPRRLHEGVHVYTVGGHYICFASCVQAAGFNDANAGREHNRARSGYLRAVKQMAQAETRMDALQAAKAHAGGEAVIPAPAAPARGKVVRGEFRDPLERPMRRDVPDTPDEAAERAALGEEIASKVTPMHVEDEWERFARWDEFAKCLGTAGETVDDELRRQYAAYVASDEYGAMRLLAEDFPERVRGRGR